MMTLQLNLGNHLDVFIKKQIESGSYQSENELISSCILLLEKEKEDSLKRLNQLLKDGEDSGYDLPFDNEEFKLEMKRKYIDNDL